jgi:hypothetical protein
VSERERRRAALHEAGHAALASALGWKVESVELDPPRAALAPLLALDPWRRAYESAVIDASGRVAELAFGPPPGTASAEQRQVFVEGLAQGKSELTMQAEYGGRGSDAAHAERTLLEVCESDRVEAEILQAAAQRRAERLVHELRPEIEAVAAALLQHGRLDRVDVEFALFGARLEREREAVA